MKVLVRLETAKIANVPIETTYLRREGQLWKKTSRQRHHAMRMEVDGRLTAVGTGEEFYPDEVVGLL